MRIAGVEAPDTAIGELALRLYTAGDVGLALAISQETDRLDLTPDDRQRIVAMIDAGLEQLADLRAALVQPNLRSAQGEMA
jgi:hypothetical protein